MNKISVVIICRNEAGTIGQTLDSLAGLTDDIVVYDSGSTDGTQDIAADKGARVVSGEWKGYGLTKRSATEHARHDWILSLDADESLSPELKEELSRLDLADERTVYLLRFLNFLGNRPLRFGEWGGDRHTRLFNRKQVHWDDAPVHESLVIPAGMKTRVLKGRVFHYTARSLGQYEAKLRAYAELNAEKYRGQGRRVSWLRQTLSAPFSFVNNYIFRLGFLDGKEGFLCARMTARYTALKYARLKELQGG